ncbi:MAG: class I fructose-bisphosphate aldolase [Solirubrobacteraceae bacterium]
MTEVLRALFTGLHTQRVTLEAVILKPNMALPSSGCAERPSAEEVVDATRACLRRAVPAAVPGIAFLSGGQAGELASARLNAMNLRSRRCVPWAARDATSWPAAMSTAPRQRGRQHEDHEQAKARWRAWSRTI